ncbi:Alpha-1-macroglobulin [Taenia crassiceps]|uniref:Alpha-1-macroglobulin n=1 Tax=Taenia crassiceps TaxID=6207 RepID=A0ABR4Q4J3_9CEST
MNGLTWQLLALLLTLTSGCFVKRQWHHEPPHEPQFPDNDVIISLPQAFFIDTPNQIVINSEKPLEKVVISMILQHVGVIDTDVAAFNKPVGKQSKADKRYTYDFKFYVPIELKPGQYFIMKITYSYRRMDNSLVQKNAYATVRMVRKFVVLMGETDKPLYRPGERVRFRFVALTSRHLLPHSKSPTWPKYQSVGESWQTRTFRLINTGERERRLQAPHFDYIVMRDPLNNIVHQWKGVQPLHALHLVHNLISDAKEGEWKIEASVRDHNETITFNVRHYIVPRFQARVELPKSIQPTTPNVTFSVCAAYTNGPFMRGTFDAQICICDKHALELQQKAKRMFAGNMCNGSDYSVPRQCKRISGNLNGAGCTKITVQMFQKAVYEAFGMEDALGVFVDVLEEDTSVSTFATGVAEFQAIAQPQIRLKFPDAYKVGLPIIGQVECRNLVDGGQELMVVMRTQLQKCDDDGLIRYEDVTLLTKTIFVKDEVEVYDLVIPPVVLQDPAFVTSRSVFIMHLDVQKSLKLWDDNEGFAIQVVVMNNTSITCPGRVNLQVQSNKVLPDNATLTLQFLARGQLTTRTINLDPGYACVPRNDEFGHYECGDGDEILCLKGWKGSNCLTPLCDDGRCDCDDACTTPGNHFGGFVEGGGALELPTDFIRRKERRTFFQHKGELELDGEFGPELRAVAYTFDSDGKMASDFVKIDGLQACSSPAMAETERGGGLQFDKQLVLPGENVSISLAVPNGKKSNEDFANTCLLSIGDVSLKQLDSVNFSIIDVNAFVSLLTSEQTYIQADAIGGTEDAYRAAGIQPILTLPKSSHDRRMHCQRKHEEQEPDVIVQNTACVIRGDFVQSDMSMESTWENGELDKQLSRELDRLGYLQLIDMDRREEAAIDMKPRLRDYFPEVWLFETVRLSNAGFSKSLTVPDALTTWEANAVCFTAEKGLWMPVKKPKLTVQMPFFVEFTPPLVARRGEVLHLPISVFAYPEATTNPHMATMPTTAKAVHHSWTGNGNSTDVPQTCYEVGVGVDKDSRDWRVVGVAAFTTCLCVSDAKKTFNLPLRPLRIGLLNVTATAFAKRNTPSCSGADGDAIGRRQSDEAVTVLDAVRRSVRVIAEGVEKRVTIGDVICTSGGSSAEEQEMTVRLPDKEIVGGSLRSYVAVSGNVVGRALANLDSLIQMPTGCGEQNLVKVAPSVYVLRYFLLNRHHHNTTTTANTTEADNSRYDSVIKKAASYVLSGFDNQQNYRHPNNGAFSIWGPRNGAKGSVWLTAYVLEVFSEADKLPIASISGQPLDVHTTLVSAFNFLRSQQRYFKDGCFEEETSHGLPPSIHSLNRVENRLHLTAHVLAALGSASTALRKDKGYVFGNCVRSSIRCIESTARQLPFTQWSTLLLAKVVHATKAFPHEANTPMREAMVTELMRRSQLQSSISGSLRWWSDSVSNITTSSYYTKVLNLETTAYALLALTPTHLSQHDQLATMQWISRQQNENGGFYSTHDTVVAVRALTHTATSFPSPTQPTPIRIYSTPVSLLDAQVEVSEDNQLVSHTLEVGSHNVSDISSLRVGIQSSSRVCVSAHFTAIYNVPQPQRQEDVFHLEISVDQGGSTATVACTSAFTTVCLRPTRAKSTGMLLVTVQLPSGWIVTKSELVKVPHNADVMKVEPDAHKQEVSVYFNGFQEEDGDAERCFTVPLHQRILVQEAQPGLVTAHDYYNPQEIVQALLHLNSCQLYWDSMHEINA